MEPNTLKFVKWGAILLVTFIILSIINPFYKVSAEERALVLNWGALDGKIIEPGLHMRVPIMQKIKIFSVQPIQLDENVAVNENGAITKDNQTIGSNVTIFYKFIPEKLPEMYSMYGTQKINDVLANTIKESFKAEIGNYTIFDLAVSQDEVRDNVYKRLTEKMAEYPIIVTEVKITNYDWSEDFDTQIKETMNRSQQVKQKEQEKLMAEQEAQKGVVQATAQKQIAITVAEGEKAAAQLHADAKALEGEGIKKYNQSVAVNWDIELKKMELEIAKIKAERWNGVFVPNNMYGPIPVNTTGGIQQ
ncbi:MAG: SPFH domain-containing protein [Candidatus Pacearchaeota archaeon]|jgi:regulator of protease activity HflC (stomatin/prohibitin superfamily)